MSYFVGGRDSDCAILFMDTPRSRFANRVQLTSDGHKAYLEAVEGAFRGDIDYAMVVKMYGPSTESAKGRYSPAECKGAKKSRIDGLPDMAHVSTSYAERQKKSMRMHMPWFTRLTDSFSKKVENHAYAVTLHMMVLLLRPTPYDAAHHAYDGGWQFFPHLRDWRYCKAG